MKSRYFCKGPFVLDAPGINGAGSMSGIKLAAYIDAGGPILHPKNPTTQHSAKVRRALKAVRRAVRAHCVSMNPGY